MTKTGLFAKRTSGLGGFAVVDLETTGLYPSTDRIVEIAVLLLDADTLVNAEFCTLVDPCRDVGPTRIHGVRACDVAGAPTFAAAAAAVWSLLSGRVLVAHNASFDVRFLDAEFGRCGVRLPPPPVMCTMNLASHYLHGLPARSLSACCDAAGVPLSRHHSAADDAAAAAGLLARFRAAHLHLPDSWTNALIQAARASWVPAPREGEFRPVTRAEQVLRRSTQRAPLADLVDRLPRGSGGETESYLGVLDRVLEDRFVSGSELTDISERAAEFGLTRDAAQRAHREYLQHVAAAAWRDRQVTDAERADLLEVARLVGVGTEEALAILQTARFSGHQSTVPRSALLQPGDRVVFSGDMGISRSEIEELATAAGLHVTSSVSGKTALVVAADPYSQSGKARLARELGVRMVTEQVFLHMIDDK
jgi:DNA polymerase-3 subunit epsilon